MLSREEILWGYRYLLGREPENEDIYELWRETPTLAAFRRILLDSLEFRSQLNAHPMPPKWVIAEVFGASRRMWVDINDRAVSFGCLYEIYEPHETAVIGKLLRPGDTFVDIGANIGWFSILASTLIGPSGRILAFEPRPDTFERLASSLSMIPLGDVAKALNVGLSDSEISMNLTWAPNSPNPGGSHLIRGDIAEGQAGACVNLKTLDSFDLASCDFIKIDIEGAELKAMQGARDTLHRLRPVILSELHSSQLKLVSDCLLSEYVSYMSNIGFACFRIDDHRLGEALSAGEADVIDKIISVVFVPEERAADVVSALRL